MRYLFILFVLILFTPELQASVTVSSRQPEYAGRKLEFYTHSDPITLKSTLLFSLQFDQAGKAFTTVDITEATCFYCDFDVYRGNVYLEPNKNITLNMPPLREKSFADQKNPYFEPIPFWFTAGQKDDLNNKISAFIIQFDQLTDKYFNQLYFQQSKAIYDSLIYQINKQYPDNASPVFDMYKKLSLKILQVDVFRLKPENYASEFSGITSANWQNPAFEDLFEKAFDNQLSFAVKSIKGGDLRKAANSSDINFLQNWVKTKFNVSGEMAQLVLLKLLNDGFYSGDFSKNAIESMVQSSLFRNNNSAIIRNTSENIYTKFTFLKNGTFAPEICLPDLKGTTICTAKNNQKYKYLIFADIEMVVCREHLKYLSAINEKYQKYLEIYVVFRDNSISEIEKFISENPVPGYLLIDKTGKFTSKYEIRSFPQCFLLDENHKVKFESAKAPLDGFEQQFGTFLRNKLIEQQRNQSR